MLDGGYVMREYPCAEPEPGCDECLMEQCFGQLERVLALAETQS